MLVFLLPPKSFNYYIILRALNRIEPVKPDLNARSQSVHPVSRFSAMIQCIRCEALYNALFASLLLPTYSILSLLITFYINWAYGKMRTLYL